MKKPSIEIMTTFKKSMLICSIFAMLTGTSLGGRVQSNKAMIASRTGYYHTTWPSEHTDLWRSHSVMDAGLPANAFSNLTQQPRLKVDITPPINLPVWGYTRDKNEVFVIGGSPVLLARNTYDIANSVEPGKHNDLLNNTGGADTQSVPFVAKIDLLTMKVRKFFMSKGKTINYTGGLLMHANGYVYAVAQSVLYKVDPSTMRAVKSTLLPLVGETAAEQFVTTYNGLQVLASGKLVLKGFSITDSKTIPGYLMLVDPDTLNISGLTSALVSSSRMTIEQSFKGPTYLYLPNVMDSTRYLITNLGFVEDLAWKQSYVTLSGKQAGSTQASSPLFFGKLGQIVFADNTQAPPSGTLGTPIQLFTQSVAKEDLPASKQLTSTPAFPNSTVPGYNFFMVAGDPFKSQLLIYYDPINKLLSAHRVNLDGSLTHIWENDDHYTISASPAIVPDRDLLYIDDFKNGNDHLVVLRLSTGKELASTTLKAKLPTIGTIFVGQNNDVFLVSSEAGGKNGLVSRITVAPSLRHDKTHKSEIFSRRHN